jgi:hypothetical protein
VILMYSWHKILFYFFMSGGRWRACFCWNFSMNMNSAIPYFAIYTFLWLIFSLSLLEYCVTYLRLTQIYQVVHCSPCSGKILGSNHFTYNVQPLLNWENAAVSYISSDNPQCIKLLITHAPGNCIMLCKLHMW